MKTIFCDIDGTLLKHNNEGIIGQLNKSTVLLNNVKDAITYWDKKSYTIIFFDFGLYLCSWKISYEIQ